MKSEKLETLVEPHVKETIEKASDLLGKTVSEFVSAVAYGEALKVIERQNSLRLAEPFFQQFLDLLDEEVQPADLSTALVSAFNAHAKNPSLPEGAVRPQPV